MDFSFFFFFYFTIFFTFILLLFYYYAKLDCIINDSSKFHQINQDTKVHPIIKKEKSINYYVKKYLKSYEVKQ